MEITKEFLEEKMKTFIEQHKQLSMQINDQTILRNKLEGAIETFSILLKELETKKVDV